MTKCSIIIIHHFGGWSWLEKAKTLHRLSDKSITCDRWNLSSHLVSIVVADDALVLGEAQLAALICGQSERGQEARSQRVYRGVIIGNYRDTETMTAMTLKRVTQQDHHGSVWFPLWRGVVVEMQTSMVWHKGCVWIIWPDIPMRIDGFRDSALPLITGTPSLSVTTIAWRPSTLKEKKQYLLTNDSTLILWTNSTTSPACHIIYTHLCSCLYRYLFKSCKEDNVIEVFPQAVCC